jgi:hypothetical protein
VDLGHSLHPRGRTMKYYRVECQLEGVWKGIFFLLHHRKGHGKICEKILKTEYNLETSERLMRFMDKMTSWHEPTFLRGEHWYTEEGWAEFQKFRDFEGQMWDTLSFLYAVTEKTDAPFRIRECEVTENSPKIIYRDDMQIVFEV